MEEIDADSHYLEDMELNYKVDSNLNKYIKKSIKLAKKVNFGIKDLKYYYHWVNYDFHKLMIILTGSDLSHDIIVAFNIDNEKITGINLTF